MKIITYFRNLVKDFKKRKEKFLWKHFNKGRTQNSLAIWKINSSSFNRNCPELVKHLRKLHPKQWYDDEQDVIFFNIYDYLLSKKIKIILRTSECDSNCYRMDMNGINYDLITKRDVTYYLISLCEENSHIFR